MAAEEAADEHSLTKYHSAKNIQGKKLIVFFLILNDNEFVMNKLPSFPWVMSAIKGKLTKKSALIITSDYG